MVLNTRLYFERSFFGSGLKLVTMVLVALFLIWWSPRPLALAQGKGVQLEELSGQSRSSNVAVPPAGCIGGSVPMVSSVWGTFDEKSGRIYIAGQGSGLWVLDPTTNASFLANDTPNVIQEVTFDPSNDNVYAVNYGSADIMVVNGTTNTQTATIGLGQTPFGVVYDSVNGQIYATSANPVTNSTYNNGTVSVIDPTSNRVTKLITVGVEPGDIAIDSLTGDIFVANQDSGNVSVIDGASQSIVGTIYIGGHPLGVAFDPLNGDIYVSDGDNISVINATTEQLVKTIPSQRYGLGVTYDQESGMVYVADQETRNVTVIETRSNTVIGNISVGNYPAKAILDPVNGHLYVDNMGSSNLSVISPAGPCVHNVVKNYSPPPLLPYGILNWLLLALVVLVLLSVLVLYRKRREAKKQEIPPGKV